MKQETTSKPSGRSRQIGVILGLLVSAAAILWLFRSVEADEIFAHVKEVNIKNLVLAVALTCTSYLLRSFRWPFFFDRPYLNFADSFRCLIVGFFMNNTLPARMGEFVRAHLGGRATKQSRTVVLATIAGERIVDGLTISVLFAVLFTLRARPEEIALGSELFLVALFFAAASIGTVVVIVLRHRIFHLLEKISALSSGGLSKFTLLRIRKFIEGLEPMLRPNKLIRIALLSLLIWGIELCVYFQIGLAFNQSLSLGAASLFLAAVNFSSLIPSAPGGIGVIELFATAALTKIGLEREAALAMVGSQHLIQIAVVGIPGLYFFFSTLGGKIPLPQSQATEQPNFP